MATDPLSSIPKSSRNSGIGLVEIIVGIVVITGVILLLFSWVSDVSTSTIKIDSVESCQQVLQGIVTDLQKINVEGEVTNWLPKNNQAIPIEDKNHQISRMQKMIFSHFSKPQDVLQSTVLAKVAQGIEAPYTEAETSLKLTANNYQLVYNLASILSGYTPEICEGIDIPRNKNDYLGEIFSKLDASVTARMQVLSKTCKSEELRKASAAVEIRLGFEGGTCSQNINLVARQDKGPPQIDSQLLLQVNGFNEASQQIDNSRVFCGPANTPSITFNVAQVAGQEEPGVQYVCRLDYEGRNYSSKVVVNPFRSTGWFVCSIPEAPIENLLLPGNTKLIVSAVNVSDGSAPATIQFTVSNWMQGTYKLHVKAIDVAQNESLRTQKFYIDSMRPSVTFSPPASIQSITSSSRKNILVSNISALPLVQSRIMSLDQQAQLLNSTLQALEKDLYQCVDKKFYAWKITGTEDVEVTPTYVIENYHAGTHLLPMNCQQSSQHPTGDWQQDGPHTVQAIACDACGSGVAASQVWYLDTNGNYIFSPPTNLTTASSAFSYHAGTNQQNPYALTYEVYESGEITSYRYADSLPVFPAQSGIGGDCMPHTRGKYCYYAVDGCGRIVASPSYSYQVGTAKTSYYCPSFTCNPLPSGSSCPSTKPIACDCVTDTSKDSGSLRQGRFTGDPNAPGCTYEESLGICCRAENVALIKCDWKQTATSCEEDLSCSASNLQTVQKPQEVCNVANRDKTISTSLCTSIQSLCRHNWTCECE